MKKKETSLIYFVCQFVVLFCGFYVNSFAQTKTGINFVKLNSWEETLINAKKHGKNIFVDAYTTWCGPCKMMDNKTYQDSTLGFILNKDFISIKVQMDRTTEDNIYIKSWYADADKIKGIANIEAFPTLLFYSPDGELVFKSVGFKSANALQLIAKYFSDPTIAKRYRKDMLAYQKREKEYVELPDLITTTREVLGDSQMALNMAKDYKLNYLDKLCDTQALTPDNVKFIAENGDAALLNSKDIFFDASYQRPQIIDSILGNGIGEYLVKAVITKEEITDKVYSKGKPLSKHPNWHKIVAVISKKYQKIDIEKFMISAKKDYYRTNGNWGVYTKLKSDEINATLKKGGNLNVFDELNAAAWDVFLHCNDKIALGRALKWSELSMELEMPNPNIQYYDTRANLLYKLGRTAEAINLQRKAVELNDEQTKKIGENWYPEYTATLIKMLNGEPTWDLK